MAQPYYETVLDYGPVSYLRGNETSGTNADDSTSNNYDGTYSNVTLNGYTGFDGSPAPQYVPASTSYTNWYSAGLSGAFNSDSGTLAAWVRVDSAWNDSTTRTIMMFKVDASNYVYIWKGASGNLGATYRGGGSSVGITDFEAQTGTDWVFVVARYDTTLDQIELFVDGDSKVANTGLGTWAGSIAEVYLGTFNGSSQLWDGGIAHTMYFDRYLSNAEIAALAVTQDFEWRDPVHHKGYLYVHRPEIVYQSPISNWAFLSFQSVVRSVIGSTGFYITGDINDVKVGMTLAIGSSPGLADHGRTRIMGVTTGTHTFTVWTPVGVHDGELDPSTDYYITVYDEYRVWMKPPYAADGSYWYDGQQVPQGATYDQYPIANAGVGYAGFVDQNSWAGSVDFDGSGSFAVADDAQLGGLTSDLFGAVSYTLTASSGTPANAVDNNTGTYWEPASSTGKDEYMHVDFGQAGAQPVRYMSITASASSGPTYLALQHSDDNDNWITALYLVETAWSANEKKEYDIHYVGSHRYWRLYTLEGCVAGVVLRIEEWELKAEDRTAGTSPYSWDVGDGTITSGTSTSESITVSFPPGFRYVELTITDTNAESGVVHVPVFLDKPVAATTLSGSPDYTGASYAGSNTDPSFPASNAFDGTSARWQTTTDATSYVQVQFAQKEWLGSYDIQAYIASYAPKFWYVQASNDGTNWTFLESRSSQTFSADETKSYTLDNLPLDYEPQPWTYYRLTVFDNGGGSFIAVKEWTLNYPDSTPIADNIIKNFEVVGASMEPMGQTMEFALHERLPSYNTYTEVSHSGLTASASTESGTRTADKAFQDPNGPINTSSTDYWMATTTSGTLQATWTDTNARYVKAYGVYKHPGSINNAPTAWTFQGSNDGSSWTTLDTQSSITWEYAAEEQTFDLASIELYEYYRINVSATGGGNVIISELNIYEFIPQIDGAMVMYWEDEWYTLTKQTLSSAGVLGREHMRFQGWITHEPNTADPQEYGIISNVTLQCGDVGQILNTLTDFTFMAQRDVAPTYGYEMKHANMDVYFYLMVRWLSTAAEVSDFFWSYTGDHYNIGLLAAQGSSIYDMINQKAMAIDHLFTCNKMGQLKVVPDLLRCANEFRANAETFETLTRADYSTTDFVFARVAPFHWLYGSGVGFVPPVDADDGSFAVDARFTINPGQVPGQGVNADTEHERLVSESDIGDDDTAHQTGSLAERIGHSYAQKAAYRSSVMMTLYPGGDTGLDPAEAKWLKVTLSYDAYYPRPRLLKEAKGVIKRIDITYDHNAMSKTYSIEWEEYVTNYTDAWGYSPT